MANDYTVRFLPPDTLAELRRFAPDDLSDSEMWPLTRLVERVFAAGYDAGHRRGYDEGRDHKHRPDQKELDAVRERLRAEKESKTDD